MSQLASEAPMETAWKLLSRLSLAALLGLILSSTALAGEVPGLADEDEDFDEVSLLAQVPPPASAEVDLPVPAAPAPLMSSQPPPFMYAPDAPAATNDTNFFSGFGSVQNAFDQMTPGRFKNTKYK